MWGDLSFNKPITHVIKTSIKNTTLPTWKKIIFGLLEMNFLTTVLSTLRKILHNNNVLVKSKFGVDLVIYIDDIQNKNHEWRQFFILLKWTSTAVFIYVGSWLSIRYVFTGVLIWSICYLNTKDKVNHHWSIRFKPLQYIDSKTVKVVKWADLHKNRSNFTRTMDSFSWRI